MIYVGIDWARKHHYVVVLDPNGTRLHQQSVAHTAEALAALAETLSDLEPDPEAVRVAIELHDGSMLVWLAQHGYSVFPLNPKSADRARDRYNASGAKSDKGDAFVLADTLRTDAGFLRQLTPPSERAQELLEWLQIRDGLVRERTAVLQQLRAILDEWCPELSRLCSDLHCQWTRALLTAFPLQQDLAGVDLARVQAACGRKFTTVTKERLEATVSAECLPIPPGRHETLRWRVRHLVARIEQLSMEIKEIERRLQTLADAHPYARLTWSLPVRGIVTRAALLAIMEMANGATWRELAACWGVAPVTKQSGKKKSVRRRRACDHFICQVLIQFAHCTALIEGSWAQEFYRQKRDNGAAHFTVLRQLARQWVKVLCSMWRNGTTYDERLHQNNRNRKAA
jgi:transposase